MFLSHWLGPRTQKLYIWPGKLRLLLLEFLHLSLSKQDWTKYVHLLNSLMRCIKFSSRRFSFLNEKHFNDNEKLHFLSYDITIFFKSFQMCIQYEFINTACC